MENKTVYQISCKIRAYPPVKDNNVEWNLIGPQVPQTDQRNLVPAILFEDFGKAVWKSRYKYYNQTTCQSRISDST